MNSESSPSLRSRIGPPALSTTVYSYSDWAQVQSVWSELVETSPYASFFLTREWVESWLEFYGDLLKPHILVFHGEGNAVGACLLVERTIFTGPFPVRCVFINTSGEDQIEETCADFNNLLCLKGWEEAVAAALKVHLDQRSPDEISATGFAMGRPLDAMGTMFIERTRSDKIIPSFYVDLARLRREELSYEDALSHKTRTNVRRRFRKYGTVQLEAASDVTTALRMFEELTGLHQATWKARGLAGSFASPRMVAFVRDIIRRAFPLGAIQLLRVATAEDTIGLKLNFVHRQKVYSYISGLSYDPDPQLSPGIVTLTACIRYCLEQGLDEYDFLAGNTEHKKQLSTNYRNLAWTVFQKPTAKMHLIKLIREIKQRTIRQMNRR